MRSKAAWLLIAGFAALPAFGQERQDRVSLQVPEAVAFRVTDQRTKTESPSSPCDLRSRPTGARAPAANQRAGGEPGPGRPPKESRITFAAHAGGGTAFSGSLRDTDYTPIFEGDALASSGRVEVAWTLEAAGDLKRAGNHAVTLRWKVEAIAAGGDERRRFVDASRSTGVEPGSRPGAHGEPGDRTADALPLASTAAIPARRPPSVDA